MLDVEAGEPHRGGCHEDEPRRPSQTPERVESPRERQNGRRETERNHIGQRVELEAELARGAGHARNPAVEHVQHDGDADEGRRGRELAAHRIHDAGVAAEHVRHREHAWQQVDAAAQFPA